MDRTKILVIAALVAGSFLLLIPCLHLYFVEQWSLGDTVKIFFTVELPATIGLSLFLFAWNRISVREAQQEDE